MQITRFLLLWVSALHSKGQSVVGKESNVTSYSTGAGLAWIYFGKKREWSLQDYLGSKESLECMHTFFTFTEDIFKKLCKICNHNAMMFWVVARVLLRYSEQLLTCCSVVARMFWMVVKGCSGLSDFHLIAYKSNRFSVIFSLVQIFS